MNYPRYKAIDGQVCVRDGKEWRPVSSALTTKGHDLDKYESALEVARGQRAQNFK